MRSLGIVIAFIALVGLLVVQPRPATAQEGPDPSECQVEPRSDESLTVLFATPAAIDATAVATPATPAPVDALPEGEPAGPEALFGINQTLREMVSCLNAGDPRRALALFTDDVTPETLVVLGLSDRGIPVAGTPTPLPADQQLPFLSIRDPRILEDGRVGAIVSDDTRPDEAYFIIFEEVEGRWLIDEAFSTAASGAAGP
jgi:hypothetical protein